MVMENTQLKDLLKKYDVQGPRYTSYPTVPCWDTTPTEEQWIALLSEELNKSIGMGHGAALYLHIPFCEALCTFCACNRIVTRKHERSMPYIKALHQEWAIYKSRLKRERIPVSEIHIGGGTPTFMSAEELKLLLEPLLADLDLLPNAELSFEADPRVTNTDHLQALYDLGFRRISLGIQDYDPAVQKAIHREQSVELVRDLTETARSIGYTSVNFDMVYGLPKQKLASVEDTFRHVIAQKPDRIAFYGYAHVPWVENTGQRGFTEADLPSGDEKRALYERGRGLLEQAGYQEIGMDHFALPHDNLFSAAKNKSLFRNFMGYVPGHVSPLISLGCSSISDSWTAFIQNEKNIEMYQDTVAEGRLPISKGHLLTEEDLYIRRHILELMTRFETKWNAENPFLSDVQARLQEAVNDNLIEIAEGFVRLKESGKPFIRNICMAFDARLQRQKPGSRIYSRTI